jgi:hypothetical protein
MDSTSTSTNLSDFFKLSSQKALLVSTSVSMVWSLGAPCGQQQQTTFPW